MSKVTEWTACAVFMLAGCASGGDVPVLARWTFDAKQGTTLEDASGNRCNGIVHGATPTEGRVSNALAFDGTDDYVEVPAAPALDAQSGFSIDAWVRLDAAGRDQDRVIVAQADAPRGNGGWGLNWGYGNDIWWAVDGDYRRLGTAPVGEWVHLTLVSALNGRGVCLYVNGKQLGQTFYSKTIPDSKYPFTIGRRGQGHFFCGAMDEITIYGASLTEEEVRGLQQGKPIKGMRAAMAPRPEGTGFGTGAPKILAAWGKPEAAMTGLVYCSRVIAFQNRLDSDLEVQDVWVDGVHASARFATFAGTPAMPMGVYVDPPVVPSGGLGLLHTKVLGEQPLPDSMTVQLRDAAGKLFSQTVRFASPTPRIKAMAFAGDLSEAWLYVSGAAGTACGEVTCLWPQTPLEANPVQPEIPAGGVLPIHLRWAERLVPGTPLVLRVATSAGPAFARIRAFPATFPIGMYRVQRQPIAAGWKPPAGREWLEQYRNTFAVVGRESCAAPDAWLEDCRRHLIDTIVPDYVTRDGDPGRLTPYGMTAVPYGRHQGRYAGHPAVSAWYSIDEPQGVTAEGFSGVVRRIRAADPAKPVVVTINPPVLPRGDLCDAVDIGYQDTYPVPVRPLDDIRRNVEQYCALLAPRPVVFIPQCFRIPSGRRAGWSRFPTPDEERYMVCLSVAAGARGEVYFAYNVEPSEPVEGCGVSKTPEARLLWEEIGRINLQLGSVAELLARSVPFGRATKGKVEAVTLLSGADTALVVLLNHDYAYTAETFVPHPTGDLDIEPALPPWIGNAEAWHIAADDVTRVPFGNGHLHTGSLRSAALVLITNSAEVGTRVRQRHRELQQRRAGAAIRAGRPQ